MDAGGAQNQNRRHCCEEQITAERKSEMCGGGDRDSDENCGDEGDAGQAGSTVQQAKRHIGQPFPGKPGLSIPGV